MITKILAAPSEAQIAEISAWVWEKYSLFLDFDAKNQGKTSFNSISAKYSSMNVQRTSSDIKFLLNFTQYFCLNNWVQETLRSRTQSQFNKKNSQHESRLN